MCILLQEYVYLKNTVIIFVILPVVLNISGFFTLSCFKISFFFPILSYGMKVNCTPQ